MTATTTDVRCPGCDVPTEPLDAPGAVGRVCPTCRRAVCVGCGTHTKTGWFTGYCEKCTAEQKEAAASTRKARRHAAGWRAACKHLDKVLGQPELAAQLAAANPANDEEES